MVYLKRDKRSNNQTIDLQSSAKLVRIPDCLTGHCREDHWNDCAPNPVKKY